MGKAWALGILVSVMVGGGTTSAVATATPSPNPVRAPWTVGAKSHPHPLELPARVTAPLFTAVSFISPSAGWVAGPGFIWHTHNAGRTWTEQYHGPVHVIQLQALDQSTAYAWSKHRLLITQDGGRSWRHVARAPSPFWFWSVNWPSPGTGYAVIGNYRRRWLEATQDGGRSWHRVREPGPVTAIAFGSAKEGWAVAPFGHVFRTTDGGRTWILVYRHPRPAGGWHYFGTEGIWAASPREAWVEWVDVASMTGDASTAIARTTNGTTWTVVLPSGPSNGSLVVTGPQSALVMGGCPGYLACGLPSTTMTVTHDNGRHWSPERVIPHLSPWVIPGPQSLSFPTPGVGWLVFSSYPNPRSSGAVFRTRDGGDHWYKVWPKGSDRASWT